MSSERRPLGQETSLAQRPARAHGAVALPYHVRPEQYQREHRPQRNGHPQVEPIERAQAARAFGPARGPRRGHPRDHDAADQHFSDTQVQHHGPPCQIGQHRGSAERGGQDYQGKGERTRDDHGTIPSMKAPCYHRHSQHQQAKQARREPVRVLDQRVILQWGHYPAVATEANRGSPGRSRSPLPRRPATPGQRRQIAPRGLRSGTRLDSSAKGPRRRPRGWSVICANRHEDSIRPYERQRKSAPL